MQKEQIFKVHFKIHTLFSCIRIQKAFEKLHLKYWQRHIIDRLISPSLFPSVIWIITSSHFFNKTRLIKIKLHSLSFQSRNVEKNKPLAFSRDEHNGTCQKSRHLGAEAEGSEFRVNVGHINSLSQRPSKWKTKLADTGVDSFPLSSYYPSLPAGVRRMGPRETWHVQKPRNRIAHSVLSN